MTKSREYTNECPITFDIITAENGIMVITFDLHSQNDKPSVTYYTQEGFETGWQKGCCPESLRRHCMSVALSDLTDEQLSSLNVPGQSDALQNGGKDNFHKKSYASVFFKSIEASHKIQQILDGFKVKIDTVGQHHMDAIKVAEDLYKDLTKLNENTFNKLDDEKLAAFPQQAQSLITIATPLLQKDLGWGSYLTNLATELCNSAVKFFTVGRHPGFFKVKDSGAVENAKELERELKQLYSPKLD
ncbi:hypothetical protein TUM19329_30940 [Legionella antarctica]|uniref:Uncharacterized protein n=1 Tax=Legionella antarctica TaxID=2708020 RepID=A0A6F8T928_9GAMM|nr:hypothetical protein [Legionella antarctica]BCA96733.1 hypothetical protein TUM19329_30940 [Legionella antarctica]